MSPIIGSAGPETRRQRFTAAKPAAVSRPRRRHEPSDAWFTTTYAVLGIGLALIPLGTASGAWMN